MFLLRLLKILRVALHFGLDEFLLGHERLVGARTLLAKMLFWRKLEQPRGVRLRLALESLGPIFVKFGQVLSTRRDILPPDLADELAKLQDRVPPIDPQLARAVLIGAYGKPPEQVFNQFEATPIASASVAQVHFAQLPDGTDVAIKILRPGIINVIEQDLALLRVMAGLMERLFADGKRLKPREVVEEFDTYLHDELDLGREAANASQLRRNFLHSHMLLVPEIHWDWCRRDVMVMQRMYGTPIGQIDKLIADGIDLKQLGRFGVEIFFTQVFRDGFFHADMHPGNIMVAADGRYIALDFGIIGTLTDYDKHYLAVNFLAFFNRDYKRVASAHIESGWVPADTRVEELEAAVRTVCEPIFDRPLAEISFGQVLLRLFETSRRFNVEIQPQLVLLQKTLLNIEGLGRQLDPQLDLWQTAKPFLMRWMDEQIGMKALLNNFKREAPQLASLIPILPRKLSELMAAGNSESLHQAYYALMREQKRQNWLLALIAALILASILLR